MKISQVPMSDVCLEVPSGMQAGGLLTAAFSTFSSAFLMLTAGWIVLALGNPGTMLLP